ncbi:hypothetical protein FOZ63_009057, partial [Perkinsus olseni]
MDGIGVGECGAIFCSTRRPCIIPYNCPKSVSPSWESFYVADVLHLGEGDGSLALSAWPNASAMSSKDRSNGQDCFRKIGTDEEELTMANSDRDGCMGRARRVLDVSDTALRHYGRQSAETQTSQNEAVHDGRSSRPAGVAMLDRLFEKHSYERFLETDWMLERWKLKGKEEGTDFGERIAQLANSTVEERWVGEILGATEVVLGRIHRTSQMIREARLPKDREEWLAGGPRGIYVLATAKACGEALRDLETWFSLLVSLLEVYQRQLSGLSKKVTRLERTVKGLRGNSRKVRLEDRRIGQKH